MKIEEAEKSWKRETTKFNKEISKIGYSKMKFKTIKESINDLSKEQEK